MATGKSAHLIEFNSCSSVFRLWHKSGEIGALRVTTAWRALRQMSRQLNLSTFPFSTRQHCLFHFQVILLQSCEGVFAVERLIAEGR